MCYCFFYDNVIIICTDRLCVLQFVFESMHAYALNCHVWVLDTYRTGTVSEQNHISFDSVSSHAKYINCLQRRNCMHIMLYKGYMLGYAIVMLESNNFSSAVSSTYLYVINASLQPTYASQILNQINKDGYRELTNFSIDQFFNVWSISLNRK